MKLKLAVTLTLIIVAIVVGGIFIADKLASQDPQPSTNQSLPFTTDEVAQHDKQEDCWVIINNEVYDVTNFISSHPGGVDRIVQQCGKNATTAFSTQGGEGEHSSQAKQQLESLKIGQLVNVPAN